MPGHTDCTLEAGLGYCMGVSATGLTQVVHSKSAGSCPPGGCLWVEQMSPAEDLFISILYIFGETHHCHVYFFSSWG